MKFSSDDIAAYVAWLQSNYAPTRIAQEWTRPDAPNSTPPISPVKPLTDGTISDSGPLPGPTYRNGLIDAKPLPTPMYMWPQKGDLRSDSPEDYQGLSIPNGYAPPFKGTNKINFFNRFVPRGVDPIIQEAPQQDEKPPIPPIDWSTPRSLMRNTSLGLAQGVADTGDMIADPLGSAVAAYAGLHNMLAPHMGWDSYTPEQIADVQRQVPRPLNKVLGYEVGAHPASQGLSWLENKLGFDTSPPTSTADKIARYGSEALGGALVGGGVRSLLKSPIRGRLPGTPPYTSTTASEMAYDNARAAAAAEDPNYIHSGLEVWDGRPINPNVNVRQVPKIEAFSQYDNPDAYARSMTPQFGNTYNKTAQQAYEDAYDAWAKWKADLNQNK